jgi:hypothetical protein
MIECEIVRLEGSRASVDGDLADIVLI